MESTILGLAAITSIASCVAAIGAFHSARMTRVAAEAAFGLHVLEGYTSEEMGAALRRLAEIGRKENFAMEWKNAKRSNDEWAKEIDNARRKVSGYFINLAQLYSDSFITANLLRTLTHHHGINVLFDVNEPLERALNPSGYAKKYFDILRKECGRWAEGEMFSECGPSNGGEE